MTAPATSTTLPTAPGLRQGLGQPQIAQLCAALVAFAAMAFVPQVLNDGDTYWHLAAGEWMLAHGRVLHSDVFSFTHFGQKWATHEWLSEVLMGLAFRAASWNGVLLLFAAITAAGAALVARTASRSLGGVSLLVLLLLAAACAAPSLLVRPHLLALPAMIAWTAELLAAREAGRAPRLFIVALMMLWANLHGSYVFGFIPFGFLALEAIVEARGDWLRAVRDWFPVGALSAVATLATPHGLNGLVYPYQIMTLHTLSAIIEWAPADFSRATPFEAALLATLFVGLGRGVRIPVFRLLALLLMLHMSLQHGRHQLVLAVIAPLFLAQPFAQALGQRPRQPAGSRPAWLIFAVAAVLLATLRIANPAVRDDAPNTPGAALAHVPASLAARPMINAYDFGGYLIFRGVRPFIDGRTDMYGDAYFARQIRIVGGDVAAFNEAVRRYQIAWTMLRPDEPLVGVLDHTPGWRRLYADRYAVIHVQTAAMPPASPPHGHGAPAR